MLRPPQSSHDRLIWFGYSRVWLCVLCVQEAEVSKKRVLVADPFNQHSIICVSSNIHLDTHNISYIIYYTSYIVDFLHIFVYIYICIYIHPHASNVFFDLSVYPSLSTYVLRYRQMHRLLGQRHQLDALSGRGGSPKELHNFGGKHSCVFIDMTYVEIAFR